MHSDDGKDELEEDVDNEDVGDVLEWVHHAVKHSLRQREISSEYLQLIHRITKVDQT